MVCQDTESNGLFGVAKVILFTSNLFYYGNGSCKYIGIVVGGLTLYHPH